MRGAAPRPVSPAPPTAPPTSKRLNEQRLGAAFCKNQPDTPQRSRHAIASEFVASITPGKTEGAGKAGCPPHPWSACNKKARGRTTGTGGSSGLPCAMVLRLIRALLGDHRLLPP